MNFQHHDKLNVKIGEHINQNQNYKYTNIKIQSLNKDKIIHIIQNWTQNVTEEQRNFYRWITGKLLYNRHGPFELLRTTNQTTKYIHWLLTCPP
jgi:hypothetical protein